MYFITSIRLIVRNHGKEAAQRVEVVGSDLEVQEANGQFQPAKDFVSTPMTWTHSDSSICEFLPGEADRLCDVGQHHLDEHPKQRAYFQLAVLVRSTARYEYLNPGTYRIRMTATALNCPAATAVLSITVGNSISVELEHANRRKRSIWPALSD